MQYYPPLASFSLVREYKIKWWEKFAVNKFCSLDVVQPKILHTPQSMIPATPATPQKKQERSSKDKGKATSSNELDELQLLKKEIKLLKKQKQLLLSKATSSASPTSSDHSDYDPWGGPCAQDPYDY